MEHAFSLFLYLCMSNCALMYVQCTYILCLMCYIIFTRSARKAHLACSCICLFMYLYICNRPVVFVDRQPTQARKWGRKTRLASTAPPPRLFFCFSFLYFFCISGHIFCLAAFFSHVMMCHSISPQFVDFFTRAAILQLHATADALHIDAIIGPEVLFVLDRQSWQICP